MKSASAHLRYLLGAALLSAPWFAACDNPTGGTSDTPTTPGSTSSSSSSGATSSWTTTPGTTGTGYPAVEPPAISGGTLLVLHDGHTVAASDPDQDMVWFVDLSTQDIVASVALQPGDEPGRLVEDAAGRVHVLARRGGALITIDPTTHAASRRAVCPTPRGIAYDAAADALQVACADGLLATLPAAGGAPTASVRLDRDLRDVVIQGGTRYVSRFRSAQILAVAPDGTVTQRITLPTAQAISGDGGVSNAVPSVAYRMIAMPGGGLAVLHQRALDAVIDPTAGGYSAFGMCPGMGIVQDTVTFVTPGTAPSVSPAMGMTILAVDAAVSADGSTVAVAAPGSTEFGTTVLSFPIGQLQAQAPPGGCLLPSGTPPPGGGQPIAVAFDAQNRLVTQTRAPAAISVDGTFIPMPSAGPTSDGHTTFHTGTKGGIACASCHPEGGDDGRVWTFAGFGARRTQNIRGGVLARAPFHWTGDLPDMDALVSQVFEGRMSGQILDGSQIGALGHWMDAQPALAAPAMDAAAVARGQATFEDPAVGCATCHSGPQLSNHAIVDVGTGGAFKVPSLLGVGYRAPYLHDGCAATLPDRFGPSCGGGDQHGHTSQLSSAQLGDLVTYLESL